MRRQRKKGGRLCVAQKNATPSKEQQQIMAKHKLPAYLWTVMKEFNHALMVRHRVTGEVRVIDKK